MDDNDVCPLCCEELDISDQQFFPCKCGYQVCMWCWHRIRESESGLCPACRTPYGDDPHEFSAVDMEEVVKANKEKAAAEKREKERLRQQQAAAAAASGNAVSLGYAAGGGGVPGVGGMHIGGGSDGDLALAMAGGARGQLDPPKDRNQLANMRVIRRNLVYAVGLPPSIATEDMLRKSDYFGQYGKISKIVLNRNHNGNGDPRRASASAYVTFQHKEDALSCILGLDGFYVDGRNIRASYGTSKYCSAFIKNVRCNNPDCTYLHCMGDTDDTFTKQEIQAGYVTSGRDVLARHQQQIAAAASSSSGPSTRRRVGGGGPSGTGKVASNPVFPPPTFDEPSKPSQTTLVPPPPSTSSTTQFPPVSSTSMSRSSSAGTAVGFSSVAAGSTGPSAAAVAAGKIPRSVSVCVPVSSISSSTPTAALSSSTTTSSQKPDTALTPAEMLSRQQEQLRKLHPQNTSKTSSINKTGTSATVVSGGQKKAAGALPAPPGAGIERSVSLPTGSSIAPSSSVNPTTTAASVVAGVHSTARAGPPTQPAPHTTLTSLTPLKRASSLADKKENTIGGNNKTVSSLSDLNADSVHLPPNMPVPKGLTPAEQAAFLEQRKEAMVTMARQQREMALKLSALRSGSTSIGNGNQQSNGGHGQSGTATSSPTSSISSASGPPVAPMKSPSTGSENGNRGPGIIGGSVIGGNIPSSGSGPGAIGSSIGRSSGQPLSGGLGSIGAVRSDNSGNGGLIIGKTNSSSLDLGSIGGSSPIGGLGGQAIGSFGGTSNSVRGNGIGNNSFPSQPSLLSGINDDQGGIFGPANGKFGGISGAGIWGNETSGKLPSSTPIGSSNAVGSGFSSAGSLGGSGVIGGGRITGDSSISTQPSGNGGSFLSKNPFGDGNKSGSSALASMLGIELPTGTGSLRESLWESSTPVPATVGSFNSSAPAPTPIGSGMKSNGLIIGGGSNFNGAGGIPIGGYGSSTSTGNGGGSNNDIALLQSLLPGVHITSGNAYQPAAPNANGTGAFVGSGWGSGTGLPPAPAQLQQQRPYGPIGVGGLNMQQQQQLQQQQQVQHQQQQQQQQQGNDTWGRGGLYSNGSGPQNIHSTQQQHQQQHQQHQPSIW